MTDLSKAFHCIDYSLLMKKLDAYGFEKHSIDFLHSHLTKHKQRTKVDSAYSLWEMLLSGVSQSSISGSLLFNVYIYIYMQNFFETRKNIGFTGYADDNTPYTGYSNVQEVLENLQGTLKQLFQWFPANHLVANAKKCHLPTSSKIHKQYCYL